MADEDILLPENGAIQVGSLILTFQVTNYAHSGGERTTTFIRTMGRNFRRHRTNMTDHEVNLDVTMGSPILRMSQIADTLGSVGSVMLKYTGDLAYTLSYHNCYSINFTEESGADNYLKGRLMFRCAPYDINGSPNRVFE